jgi:hypothetical protein
MNVKVFLIAVIISTAVVVSGCVTEEELTPTEKNAVRAKIACELTCKQELSAGKDLSSGPCLSNEIVLGWVCDVAHEPREMVDNELENQCPEFGKTASHFIEVSPTCEFIRAV